MARRRCIDRLTISINVLFTAALFAAIIPGFGTGPVRAEQENPLGQIRGDSADAFRFEVIDNRPDAEVTFDCVLEGDELQAMDGAGVWIRISDTLRPVVTLESLEIRRLPLDRTIIAADHPAEAGNGLEPEDEEMTGRQSALLTAGPLAVGAPMIMRSIRLIPIRIRPVQVDSNRGELVVIDRARIRVTMAGVDDRNILTAPPPITRTFDAYYRAMVLNYEFDRERLDRNPETYLVFTPDEYESRLQGWLAWKETEGFRVDILRKSTLPAWPAPADLRNALLAHYTGPNPPVFVLFVGDEYAVPVMLTYDPTHPGDYADDLFYSTLAGDDLLPEFFLGRLPAVNASEVTIMLNKVMQYELNPNTEEPGIWSRSLMAGSNLEPTQIETKEQTRDRLETYCGHTEVLTYYYDWNDSMIQDLMDDIDEGVSVINYRGEGWRKGWNPLHEYWFEVPDVYMLRNPNRTPYVSSIGCGVCLYNTDDDCWGHALMAHGSPSVPMGAVAVVGPTWNTHTTYNNWMDRGIYRGYCLWDVIRSGPMMDYGKAYVISEFPDLPHEVFVDQHCRTYLLFGTPDMWVRMTYPHTVVAGLAYANNGMSRYLALRDTSGSVVGNAQISWNADDHRYVDISDAAGGIAITDTNFPDNSFEFVVTGRNLIPLHGDLTWSFPEPDGYVIITEVKPDIATTGTTGDMIELFNPNSFAIDLNGWILSDLDGYDTPFVHSTAILQPDQIAVVEFVGPMALQEQVIPQPYGLLIRSLELPDFSSLEDVVVLRDPAGWVADSMAYHDNTGTSSTDLGWDMTYLAGPNSPFSIREGGWWDAPDIITQDQYELYAVDWSPFAGMSGDGSMQRATVSFPDGADDWTIAIETSFGHYTHQEMTAQSNETPKERIRE